MTPEQKLYQRIKPHILEHGTCDRVENTMGSGTPDVVYCVGGTFGWLETKVAKGEYLYFEKFQPNWFSRYWKAGAQKIFVVAEISGGVCIWSASLFTHDRFESYGKWRRVNINNLPRPVLTFQNKIDSDRLRLLLT